MSAPWIAAFVVLWVVVVLLALIVSGLLRRVTDLLERLEGASAASDVPLGAPPLSMVERFDLRDDAGDLVPWSEFVSELTMLLLMSSRCSACDALAESLESVGDRLGGIPFVVVVDGMTARMKWGPAPGLRVLYQPDAAATKALRNRGTPQAYVVDPEGLVLARRVPGAVADLEEMARFQYEGNVHADSHRGRAGNPLAIEGNNGR